MVSCFCVFALVGCVPTFHECVVELVFASLYCRMLRCFDGCVARLLLEHVVFIHNESFSFKNPFRSMHLVKFLAGRFQDLFECLCMFLLFAFCCWFFEGFGAVLVHHWFVMSMCRLAFVSASCLCSCCCVLLCVDACGF